MKVIKAVQKALLFFPLLAVLATFLVSSSAAHGGQGFQDNSVDTFSEEVPFKKDELLVTFQPDTGDVAARAKLDALCLEVAEHYPTFNIYLVKIPPGQKMKEAMDVLSADPDVHYVEPNYSLGGCPGDFDKPSKKMAFKTSELVVKFQADTDARTKLDALGLECFRGRPLVLQFTNDD